MRLQHTSIIKLNGSSPCFSGTTYEGQEFEITLTKLTRSSKTSILKACVGENDELDQVSAVKAMFMASWTSATNIEVEVDGIIIDPATDAYKEAIFEQFSDLADIVAQESMGSNQENETLKNV